MALRRRIMIRAKADENTGFGTNSNMYGGRWFNKDGNANIHKTGISYLDSLSWYHTMIHMPGWKFYSFLLFVYILVNLLFAFIYYLIGVENLQGMVENTEGGKFLEAFFFSTQTFTTVGYGRLNPGSAALSSVAAFEAFLGLLNFALATGLLYGRFSRPRSFFRFSDHVIIAPYKDMAALMFRMVPYKNTQLTDAEVKLTLGMSMEENGKPLNRFYSLDLEISKINSLTLSWTLVHAITDKSPLYGVTREELAANKTELLVFVKAFDETFSNTVVARTSYTFDEFRFGWKFIPMYHRSEDGMSTILDLSKLNSMESAELPQDPFRAELVS